MFSPENTIAPGPLFTSDPFEITAPITKSSAAAPSATANAGVPAFKSRLPVIDELVAPAFEVTVVPFVSDNVPAPVEINASVSLTFRLPAAPRVAFRPFRSNVVPDSRVIATV